jgi:predicted nucleotidyltransferase
LDKKQGVIIVENNHNIDVDNEDVLNIAQKYANAVKLKYDFVKIILFGSYAKGTFNEDSDIDIAVILKDYNNLTDIQLDLMRLRRKIDSRIEPHPFREKDFDITNPMVNEILKYGKNININVA